MLELNPEHVTLEQLRRLWAGEAARLDDASMTRVVAAAASVERIVASGDTVYGVNTGFGSLANTRIPDDRLAELALHPCAIRFARALKNAISAST